MAVASKKKIFDDRYEILSIVGRGSRSVVYHARNIIDDGSEVALKVLIENKKDTLSNSEKLRREALAMVSSHHPHVIRLDDFHTVGDISYLSMEYAPESDLRRFVAAQGGSLPAAQAEEFLTQVAEGLEYIHRVGIIHRDMKPDNILVVSPRSVRIGDFGVALLPGDTSAPQDLRSAVGTMDYMAPEVLEGKDYNQRSDIYSLGVSFYEMLAGKHPFAEVSLAQQLEARQEENIPSLSSLRPDVPQYISDALARAMAYEQAARFQSAKELVQHLRQKRVVKNPAPARKEEKAPHLRVIPGNLPNENTPVASEQNSEQVELPLEDTPTKISEEVAVPMSSSPEQNVPESSKREEDVSEPDVEIVQISPEPIPVAATSSSASSDRGEPSPAEAPIREEKGSPPMQSAPQTPDRPGQAPILRDSRASRNPTVTITREEASKIRAEAHIPRMREKKKSIPVAPRKNNYSLALVAVGVVAALVIWNTLFTRSDSSSVTTRDSEIEGDGVAFAPGDLTFPHLPSGIYQGSITGLLPAVPLPLTLLSHRKSGQLVLLVGIDGWKPVVLPVSEDSPASVRVVSNGFIVELTGREEEGFVKGTLKNVITGTSGVFTARPVAPLS